jgi:DNA-binding XRE family transcriptional regulator
MSGAEFRAARERAGLSRRALAELLECCPKTIVNIESSPDIRGPYRWAAYSLFPETNPGVKG